MGSTWPGVSKEILGSVAPQTPINEAYVATKKIQKLLDKGKTERQIALIWNGTLGGSEKPVEKKGKNKWGISFNTKVYAETVISNLNK